MRNTRHRLAGALCLLFATGSTFVHRSFYEVARHGPAQVGELAAGLVTFISACLGVLLLIHGASLFATPVRQRSGAARRPVPLAKGVKTGAAPEAVALDSREGVALVLARRAIAAAAARSLADEDARRS